MKTYNFINSKGENIPVFVFDSTIASQIQIAENDILLLFFNREKEIVFKKHYKTWTACNIAQGKLIRKYSNQ